MGWLAGRIAVSLLLMWVVATIVFLTLHLVPGDPAELLLSTGGVNPDPYAVAELRERLGLNQPILVQYWQFLVRLSQGDLGTSLVDEYPIAEEILLRLPRTLELIAAGTLLAVAIALPCGTYAAVHAGRGFDRIASSVAAVLQALPVFVLGTLLILVLAQWLRLMPAGGYTPFAQDPARHLVLLSLPAVAVAKGLAATVFRMTRAAMLDVLSRDHVRTARAKGLTPGRVLRRHVVRNGLIPVTTVVGLQMGTLLGGTVLVEYVFNWPGLSTPLLRAVEQRDYPMVVGIVLTVSGLFLLINLVMDLLYAVLDPRIARVLRRLYFPAALVALLILAALVTPLLPLPDPIRQDVANRLAAWLPGSPLGRDEFGRDVLSRILWGARVSLSVAFASAAIACVIGTTLGLVAGWFRGVAEFLAVRAADVVLCFPPILLALLVVTLLGPGTGTLILVLSILYLPGFVRVTFAEVLSARGQDYVEAVRALGAPTPRILTRTVLPNIAGPVLVQFSLAVAAAVVVESGLSFLGLGVVPPTPSWGLMIRGARATMEQSPTLLLWPCLALTLTILTMNLLCDALRDAVDRKGGGRAPRLRAVDRVLPGLFPARDPAPLLDVQGLTVEIAVPGGVIRPVEDVTFMLRAGSTLAIVGESGSGKSITATAVMGLLPPVAQVTAGVARFEGRDLLPLPEADRRKLRGGAIAMVFQDPMSSLNPVHRVGDQVAEAIRAHRDASADAAAREAVELLRRVGIADPERRARAFPHELSGGMRQRVMIAMAIANRPRLLIADEPTTALDVTVQAGILELMATLQREQGMGMVLITHSLGVVAEVAQEVVVMYAAQVVERGTVAEVFARPLHPYTHALLAAVPDGDAEPEGIPGVVPRPDAYPPGCRFAPRCPHAKPRCERPQVLEQAGERQVRCVRWKELAL